MARIVFMGTPQFAVNTLAELKEARNEIVGVVTAPDRPAGRGQKARASAVKEYAVENDLTTLQPEKLRDPVFLEDLKALNADLFIVVAFRMLPEVVWSMPPKGTINLHASLLPQYRGAAPINWAIINGETETGVTTFFIQKEIDTGDLIYQEKVAITPSMDAGQLHDQLMQVGADLMVKTVADVVAGTNPSVPQNMPVDGELRSAPKIHKETGRIDWSRSTGEIIDHIRGLSPYPAAYSDLEQDGKKLRLKVYSATPIIMDEVKPPGTVLNFNGDMVAFSADGAIKLEIVQLAGKKKMASVDLLRGFTLHSPTKLS